MAEGVSCRGSGSARIAEIRGGPSSAEGASLSNAEAQTFPGGRSRKVFALASCKELPPSHNTDFEKNPPGLGSCCRGDRLSSRLSAEPHNPQLRCGALIGICCIASDRRAKLK